MKSLLTQQRWPLGRARKSAAAAAVSESLPEVRLRHHAALVYLSRRALETAKSTCLLGDVCRIASRVLRVDHVHVLELLPDGRTTIARAAAGWSPERLALWQMDLPSGSRVAHAMRAGGLVVLDRAREPASESPGVELLQEIQMQCGLAAGVVSADTPGLFGVYSAKSRRFSREDLQFVRAVAQIIESALKREAETNSNQAKRLSIGAAQADLLRVVVGRLRPALRESVGHLWQFRTQPTDTFTFRRAVRRTERQVACVADFIEDLSLLADLLDGRTPTRTSVLFAPVLTSLIDQLAERAQDSGVSLQLRMVDERIATSGDSALLRRALLNLLDNALRFTGPGGTVTITVSSPDTASAVIDITDTGRGMTVAQLERLSKHQDGAAESEHRGPGMGWRLACAIVQAHSGTLTAASPGPDLGSTIAISVPRLNFGGLES